MASDKVLEVNQSNFQQDVLQRSHQVPVVVDFWAPWCGPCQSLGPLLEKLTAEYAGAFTLAKINTDEEQLIASQFGVRSLPTVVLLYQGQIVDHFVGAQSEGEIRALLEKHIGPPPAAGDDDPEQDWRQSLSGLPPAAQVEALRAQLATNPEQSELQAQLADALLRQGEIEEARKLLAGLDAQARDSDAGKAAAARLAFTDAVADAPPVDQLRARLDTEPDDLDARYRLGLRLLLAGQFAPGLDELLTIMRKDRSYGDDLGRRSLVEALSMVDDAGLVSRYRSRMTSLLF